MIFSTQPTPAQRDFARDLERDVKLTPHAEERMAERGISFPTLLAIIANGRMVPNHRHELIQYKGWVVVMDENWVITAFYRDRWR